MMETMEQTLADTNQVLPYGIELDANGFPVGSYSVQEVFDELDKEFISFYGDYGRQLVNTRRNRWNSDGIWKFNLL